MIKRLLILFFSLLGIASFCATAASPPISLKSIWIKDSNNQVIQDPQTSGLILRRGKLLSIGDGSANKNMQLRLMPIDPQTAQLSDDTLPLMQSEEVRNGCFSGYLAYGPDLEALAIDPIDDNVIIIATEDAYAFKLKGDCFKKYGNTGSTKHPTLLLRVEIQPNNSAIITHTKAVQFPKEYEIGNSPNDGIEGLTFGAGRTLYLGLEKDQKGKARIFELQINDSFWQTSEMAVVTDSKLALPVINDGKNHPINALAYYPSSATSGFIFAAARNDNQIWILDTQRKVSTRIIDLKFLAESLNENCPQWQVMNNYSIEGMVMVENTLWLVNDPWKANYKRNALCDDMLPFYQQMAPLLTHLPIPKDWVQR